MTGEVASEEPSDVLARELLSAERCSVVLLLPDVVCGAGNDAVARAAESLVEGGVLRLLALPPPDGTPLDAPHRVVLSVECAGVCVDTEAGIASPKSPGSDTFYYPVIPGTPVCVAADATCLTFPAVTGDGAIYGLVFQNACSLLGVVAQLEASGCEVCRQDAPRNSAEIAATTMQQASETVVGAINLASVLLSWGIKQAAATAKQSSFMTPSETAVEVPQFARNEIDKARHATKQVVMVSGTVVEEVTKAVHQMASHVGEHVGPGDASRGVVQDAKLVGKSCLGSGVEILSALSRAADYVVTAAGDSSSDLVGHKFGEDAGNAMRDGIHIVGNVLETKNQFSKRAIAQAVVRSSSGCLIDGNLTLVHDAISTSIAATPDATSALTPIDIILGPPLAPNTTPMSASAPMPIGALAHTTLGEGEYVTPNPSVNEMLPCASPVIDTTCSTKTASDGGDVSTAQPMACADEVATPTALERPSEIGRPCNPETDAEPQSVVEDGGDAFPFHVPLGANGAATLVALRDEPTGRGQETSNQRKSMAARARPMSLNSRMAVLAVVGLLIVFVSWRPAMWLMVSSICLNIVFIVGLVLLLRHAGALELRLATLPQSPPAPEEQLEAVLGAVEGLRPFLEQAWPFAVEWAAARAGGEGIVKQVNLSKTVPKVVAVRSATTPAVEAPSSLVCYDLDILWTSSDDPSTAELHFKVPGLVEPVAIRLLLHRFECTAQLYAWCMPPDGRGSGYPYSLIELAIAPGAPRPPFVLVDIEAVTPSTFLGRWLPQLRHVASAVIVSHLLPRLMGFENRVVFDESPPRKQQDADASLEWQSAARRAGWVSRAEAELEGVVVEMLRRASGYAKETATGTAGAVAGTAASAVGVVVGTAAGVAATASRHSGQASHVAAAAGGAAVRGGFAAAGAAASFLRSRSRLSS